MEAKERMAGGKRFSFEGPSLESYAGLLREAPIWVVAKIKVPFSLL